MWLSQCCYAEPLYPIQYEDDDDEALGICGHCRDHTTFLNEEE